MFGLLGKIAHTTIIMDAPLIYVVLFFIGLLAGLLGLLVSGGTSLVSVSGMLLLGIPAQITMPTYFAGALCARLLHIREFSRAGKILWQHVIPLSIVTFVGSMIGALVLVTIDVGVAQKVASFALLLFVPLAFIKNKLGTERIEVGKKRVYLGYFLYFIIAAWTSFFAAWTGIIILYIYLFCFGMTILEVKGTDSIPGIFLNIGALLIFANTGHFNLAYMAAFVPGILIGTILGIRAAIRLGDYRLQFFVRVSVLLISFKLMFQYKILRPLFSLIGL